MHFKRGHWKIADWRGAPVLLHVSLLCWPLFELLYGAGLLAALMALPAFVFLMAVHEFGHAFMARRRGSRTLSIRLYLFHGLCDIEAAYTEFDAVLIAWGGVLAQMALLVVALLVQCLFNRFAPSAGHVLQPVLEVLIGVNFGTILLNLLPFKGLDGRRAWLIVVIALDRMRSRTRQGYAGWTRKRQAMRNSKAIADDLIERLKNK